MSLSHLFAGIFFEIIAYFILNYRTQLGIIPVAMSVSLLFDVVRITYNTYFQKFNHIDEHGVTFFSANGDLIPDEELNDKYSVLLYQRQKNYNFLFKPFFVFTMTIICKMITNRWDLPILICINYMLYELYHFIKRNFDNPFLSSRNTQNSMSEKLLKIIQNWSTRNVVALASLVGIIQGLLYIGIIFITTSKIMPGIFDELNNYTGHILTSGNNNSLLIYIAEIFDKYYFYFFSSANIIATRILLHCLQIKLVPFITSPI